jgi:ribosomal-protein-alanine N-acetyltransferase
MSTATSFGRHIRRATGGDLDRIVAIERQSFSDPWSRSSFASLVDDPRVLFAVASSAETGAVIGYAVTWIVVDEAEIANLAVTPSERGAGVGAALLDTAIAAAAARGVRAIFLEVRDSNAAARALYASRGFTQVGRRRRYYRRPVEDALVLRLDVGADTVNGAALDTQRK